ncbi:TetR family transcriptional regulator C-terminal domain-containing protein [Agromyces sp. G08B096]|uniref:TetR family transcriptional regulator C-terminal domain-containing protein n=1 Tax=Agromyces sp. G08B096 TaxID=3156399 RepID=A0AAU7W4U8_9MICO
MARSRDLAGNQARISHAVWSLLAERGPDGLTMRAVAERAQCTTGLLFSTYAGKRDLLAHARRLLHERTRVRMDRLEADAPGADGALREILVHALPLDDERREEARVWLAYAAAALGDDALADLHREYNRAMLTRVRRLVGEARPHASGEAAEATAVALVGLIEGLGALAAVDPERYTPDVQLAALDAALRAELDRLD